MLVRAVTDGVVMVVHATIDPACAMSARPRPAPRPFYTAAAARGGTVRQARKRRPGLHYRAPGLVYDPAQPRRA